MDSSVSETYGEQEGTAYNGHFGYNCYHPLFLFNQFGDLEREIEHLLTPPVGPPSHKPQVFYHSFQYQAKSWHQPRRVVAKVEWHAGELFRCVGFIVTNLTKHSKNVVKFYNGRGIAEQWIKEGKNAVKWTKLSCRTFKDNQTRLQLFTLAYHLANFLRRLALPRDVKHWSLTTLGEKLVKIGAKVTRHAKLRDVPTGRGGRDAEIVRRDPPANRVSSDPAAVCRWAVRLNRSASEKRGFQGALRTHYGWAAARPGWAAPAGGNRTRNRQAPDTGGCRCYNMGQPRSGTVRATSIWEIPAY